MTSLTAPLFDDHSDGPATGRAEWLTTPDGVRLRLALWPQNTAAGTVVIFPGRTEYVEKYLRVAAGFAQRGFASVAIDWRGQGLSDRVHDDPGAGHVDDFLHYQIDVETVLDRVRAAGLPGPFFLLGHSMGGCIGLRSLMGAHPFDAAAFSAPMWGIRFSPVLRPVATLLANTSRTLGFSHAYPPGQSGESYFSSGAFDGNTLTDHEPSWRWMRNQLDAHPELSLGGPSLHWLSEALAETRALSQMPAPALPCLTYLGSDEQIVDPARIRARMADWHDGALINVPGARHEVLMNEAKTVAPFLDQMARLFSPARIPASA